MNYSELIQLLDQASAFDLYRLRTALDNMIEDPKRLIEIKRALHLGQKIQYFETSENRMVDAIVERMKQTRVLVRNCEDNRRWDIPLGAINIRGTDTTIHEPKKRGLTKNEIQLGERVGFADQSGIERHGKVIRLNQKTVTIDAGNAGSWRVAYALLHRVIDSEDR